MKPTGGESKSIMNVFKSFIERILAPTRKNAEAQTPCPGPTPTDKTSEFVSVPADELERRYLDAMHLLLEDAQKNDAIGVLVNTVSWKLADIAHYYGPRATGDIVRRFGMHLANIAEAAEAQREADAAKEAGLQPN